MKYAIECNVACSLKSASIVKVVKGEFEYSLIPNDKGIITSIKIIKKVRNPEKFYSSIEPGKGQSKATIVLKRDMEEHEIIMTEFREIESVLYYATMGNLKHVDSSTMISLL